MEVVFWLMWGCFSRKDGSPFINLIMCVPLCDQSGKVRYYLGAQLDITDLVNDCTGLRSLERLVRRHDNHGKLIKSDDDPVETLQGDEFEQLSGVFNPQELEKLLQLRQRQLSETEENSQSTNNEKRYSDDAAMRTAAADMNSAFHFSTEGSAPPLGYYKTVCAECMVLLVLYTDFGTVSFSKTVSITSYTICLPRLTDAWNPPIASDESCWW